MVARVDFKPWHSLVQAENALAAKCVDVAVVGTSGRSDGRGDTFDSRIMMNLVAPKLGLGSRIVSLGKELPVPVIGFFAALKLAYRTFLRLKEPKTILAGVLREVRIKLRTQEKVAAR